MEGNNGEDCKNRGWPKGKKRYPKVPGAPKQPLSGYVHFLNDRRESFRKANPECSFAEISKKLASEWSQLEPESKSKYAEMAEKDKERYNRELSVFRNSQEYKNYMESQKKPEVPRSSSSESSFDIPIFTREFLEHNKARESELRSLKRQTGETQERNGVLERHVENLRSGVSRLEKETLSVREENALLDKHLYELKNLIKTRFQGLALKKHDGNLSLENVDDYIRELLEVVSSSEGQEDILPKISDVASNIDVSSLNLTIK